MPSKTLFSAPDLARLPISVNLRAISLAEAVRAALSVSVIIAAGQVLDFPPLRETALAALLTCICDPGGPIRRRVPVLLGFTFLGGLVTACFGLVRDLLGDTHGGCLSRAHPGGASALAGTFGGGPRNPGHAWDRGPADSML